jgi:hypothetical protein
MKFIFMCSAHIQSINNNRERAREEVCGEANSVKTSDLQILLNAPLHEDEKKSQCEGNKTEIYLFCFSSFFTYVHEI